MPWLFFPLSLLLGLNLSKIKETPLYGNMEGKKRVQSLLTIIPAVVCLPQLWECCTPSLCGTLTSSSGGWATESLSQPPGRGVPDLGWFGSGFWLSGPGSLLLGIHWCGRFPIPTDSTMFSPSATISPLDNTGSCATVCVAYKSQRNVVEGWQILLAMLIFSLGF